MVLLGTRIVILSAGIATGRSADFTFEVDVTLATIV